MRVAAFFLLACVVLPAGARAQTTQTAVEPAGRAHVDTLVVLAGDGGLEPIVRLATGERIAVWVESDVDVGERDAGPGPVAEAAIGEPIARFGDSGSFAWPTTPTVWTAPESGALAFDVNAWPAHRARGEIEVAVLRLGPVGAPGPAGFEAPILQLDRVDGGVRARWSDRAGFGVEPATLTLELTTSHDVVYRLGPWIRPGPAEVTLPLPPPGLALPPGVHTLRATIEDRLGSESPPATLRFDTP